MYCVLSFLFAWNVDSVCVFICVCERVCVSACVSWGDAMIAFS